MIFDKYVNLKYKFGIYCFGAESYSLSTVELNEDTIKNIQEKEKYANALDKVV